MSTQQFNDDQMLVRAYINGNEDALSQLIHRHKSRIYFYIVQIVKEKAIAEDVFQDTFIKVIHTLKRGQYKEEGKFLPWVLRIAHNLTIDHFRREKKLPTVSVITKGSDKELDIFNLLGVCDKNREQEMVEKQIKNDVIKLIEALPDEQRDVLIMRHYLDMSFKEISDKTNVSINTSLGRMRYALINMRKMIDENKMVVSY